MKLLSVALIGAALAANPIGQVLSLLSKLQNTVIADGEAEQKQFEEFADWCKDQAVQRQFEIKTGKAQIEDLKAAIEKAGADVDATNARIGELSQKIATNEQDHAAAEKIRADENGAFTKEEQELVETVDTLRRAQSVLSKHLNKGDSFAQMPRQLSELASSLNVILNASIFSTHDKRALQAFLQANEDGVGAPQAAAYESHSGGILDTLADMQDKAEDMLAEARKAEMVSQHNFDLLAQSLKDELKVQNESLANNRKQNAAFAEAKAAAEGDLAETQTALTEDQKYLADLSSNCQQRAVDWEVSTKSRAEELKALAEAKRIIQEMTGGASGRQYASLVQVEQKDATPIDRIVAAVKALGAQQHELLLTQLAGKIRATAQMSADPFAKVKGLIEEMMSRLVKEAQEEASHKAFCDKETSENEAKRDQHEATVDKLSTRIEKATANVAKLKEQIAGLQEDLASIAKAQEEMDGMRASEHEEFVKAEADFSQGLDAVRMALKVLRDYYQSSEASFVQQPAVSTHGKSTDAGGSVISMLEVAESDFARSLADARTTEDDAQSAYDTTTQDNRVLRTQKEGQKKGKEDEIGRLDQAIADADSDRTGVQSELDAVIEYLEKLRPQCTTQPESYEERKKRREAEIEGLKQALDILENETAGDAFLSIRRIHRHQ